MCRYKIPVVRNFCVPNPINSTGYTSMQLLLFYWAITWKYVCIHNKPAFYSFEEFILTAKRIHLPTLIMLQILPLLSLSLSPCVNTKINILRLPHIQSCIDCNRLEFDHFHNTLFPILVKQRRIILHLKSPNRYVRQKNGS